MGKYITVDGGTTNTRIRLIDNGVLADEVKIKLGAGAKDSRRLADAVKEGIETIIERAKCGKEDITAILAAGMITSEFGIYNVPHICAPVGIKDLSNAIKTVTLPEITDIPINFIPGVKKNGTELGEVDMMRGEECEFFGISSLLHTEKNSLTVLPGSHAKIIASDADGRIADFSTSLSGELIAAISSGTILSDAINLNIEKHDEEYLKKGYEYCSKNGINEALFKVRILKNLFGADEKSRYSFFIGAILCADVKKIAKSPQKNVYVGGKRQIKNAFCDLLTAFTDKMVVCAPDDAVDMSVSYGMICIYESKESTL